MKALIAVASRHGSTRQIAQAIAQELRMAELTVDQRDVDEVASVDGYEAVVLGSAVYMGKWLPEAQHFVERCQTKLATVPVWLFSSGPLGAIDPQPHGDPTQLPKLLDVTRARDHRGSSADWIREASVWASGLSPRWFAHRKAIFETGRQCKPGRAKSPRNSLYLGASDDSPGLTRRQEVGAMAAHTTSSKVVALGARALTVGAVLRRLRKPGRTGTGSSQLSRTPLTRARTRLSGAAQAVRAAARTAVLLLKVFPMLPSRPLDWLTPRPVVERVRYPTQCGEVDGQLYRPVGDGPHPGALVCLGVVPFGVDHPQVPRLGEALARAGFVALLYWSPAMRDFRLAPEDIGDIASAYDRLLRHPAVDPERSGLLGTCVGGAFALMAAASPDIRDRVAFVFAYAPYSSMWTLARDIASATRSRDGARAPWPVDPLTRKVYVHSLTALLEPAEATRLRTAFAEPRGPVDHRDLSADGRAIARLLTRLKVDEAEAALRRLPVAKRERLDAMSPLRYLADIRAPLIVLLHDRDDGVIPVSESRRLWRAFAGRAGVHHTEFTVFQHLDPTKGNPRLLALARELGKFYLAIYPVFRRAVAS